MGQHPIAEQVGIGPRARRREGSPQPGMHGLQAQLTRSCPLGEAVRLARLRAREQSPGDSTWLAYFWFADPVAQVQVKPASGRPAHARY
jgi:hypothetical protein